MLAKHLVWCETITVLLNVVIKQSSQYFGRMHFTVQSKYIKTNRTSCSKKKYRVFMLKMLCQINENKTLYPVMNNARALKTQCHIHDTSTKGLGNYSV